MGMRLACLHAKIWAHTKGGCSIDRLRGDWVSYANGFLKLVFLEYSCFWFHTHGTAASSRVVLMSGNFGEVSIIFIRLKLRGVTVNVRLNKNIMVCIITT